MGKSSLLNALMCPAKWTTEFEDCHFETDGTLDSVTKEIKQITGAWLEVNEDPIPLVRVFDTPGLGDSDGSGDADTLKDIVDIINSEPVQAILLVFKATDRFSSHIQKQLRTLEYILGPQLWDHVISVFTFWGFSSKDVTARIRSCVNKRKDQFGSTKETKAYCENVDFENEKAEELEEGYEEYLNVTKIIPHAFPHPVFDYEDEDERTIFFANAKTIYNNAKTMSPLRCDEECQNRLEISLRSGKGIPFVLGRDVQRFDAAKNMDLVCHLYLGLGESTEKTIRWWHNSTLVSQDKQNDQILLDVIKESRLIIPRAAYGDAGSYSCSYAEKRKVVKSLEVTVKVLPRKYKI